MALVPLLARSAGDVTASSLSAAITILGLGGVVWGVAAGAFVGARARKVADARS